MAAEDSFPCPCCGYFVFSEPPGSYGICPICFWEDDISQLRFATMGGANRASLLEAQTPFRRLGACDARFVENVRRANPADSRDPAWRTLEPDRDSIEVPLPGKDYGETYPRDPTLLYYWRRAG